MTPVGEDPIADAVPEAGDSRPGRRHSAGVDSEGLSQSYVGASASTHVLDSTAGGPRPGVPVALETLDGTPVAAEVTDAAGRIGTLANHLAPGRYRLRWDLHDRADFMLEVTVVVAIEGNRQYHLPLLVSPASVVTYLGI